MERQQHDEGSQRRLAPQGEIFSPGPDAPAAAPEQRAEDELIGVQHEQQHAPVAASPVPDVPLLEPGKGAVLEISADHYQELLAAKQKVEHERALARARRQRYKDRHPDKVKEEKSTWAKSAQGKATKAAIQRRYRERKHAQTQLS